MRHALVFNVISLITFLAAVFFLATKGLHFCDRVHRRHADRSELHAGAGPRRRSARRWRSDGFADPQVQNFGSSRDVLIRMPLAKNTESAKVGERVIESLQKVAGGRRARRRRQRAPTLKRVEFVGPQVGKELAEDGALALLLVIIGIVVYLAFRFEWRFAVVGHHRQPARRGHHPRLLRLLPVGILAAGAGRGAGRARLLGERVGRGVRPGAREPSRRSAA